MQNNNAEAAGTEAREHERCQLRVQARLDLEDGRQVGIRVSNISPKGFCGHTIDIPPVGSDVELHLPNLGTVSGKVVWQTGSAIGARLATDLSMNDITALALDQRGEPI